jgi:predicted ArsR family transcriptional regulator
MKSVLESRSVQDRIIAYLDKTNHPMRRKLKVVASILGISISQIRPALDALERAGRLKIDRWKGSLVLNTSNRAKARQRVRR